ncbi:uncharacterized protein LOC126908201 [Daktulosphaira vitifoliae]|uniref:uncharacterized protein LOC126908201 n=1 Tax=Daktulosphaira vitifoliae TaxID=58002 RepID=UPI0021AA79C1|nr:uncharacterized protein LOC126908201 [Daktulosphaira vitifoliae]
MKIFIQIQSPSDCIRLQTDLDKFFEWSTTLGLSLNPSKCKVITFSRSQSPIFFPYRLGNDDIPRVYDNVRDLGFILSHNLDPSAHIQHVCCKALKMLGIIIRLSREFKLGSSVKILFCSLVRPILEYGSVVWDPHTAENARQLERVQNKFLCFAGRALDLPCPPHDYTPVANHLGLSSLSLRRNVAGSKFLKGLLDGKVECPALLSLVPFRVPQINTRSNAPFRITQAPTNYLLNEPLRRLLRYANSDPNFML